MRQAIWSRVGPATGVLFFVLIMAGAMIHGYPDIRPTDSQLSNWLANLDLNSFRLGIYIETFGILFFIPYAAWLYGRLRQSARNSSWPAITMLAAGAIWVAFTLPVMGGWWGLAEQARTGLDVKAAQTIVSINQASYDLTNIVLGLTLLMAGVAVVQGGAMSRWAGWVAIAVGLMYFVSLPLGASATPAELLGYLWFVAVGIFYTFRPALANEFVSGPAHQPLAAN